MAQEPTNNNANVGTEETQLKVSEKLSQIANNMAALNTTMKGNVLGDAEAKKEQQKKDEEANKDRDTTNSLLGELIGAVTKTVQDENPLAMLGLAAALLFGAVAAFVGFLSEYFKTLKTIFDDLKDIFGRVVKKFREWFGKDSAIGKAVQEFIDRVRDKFKNLKDKIMNSKFVKRIQDFIDTFRLKIWEVEDKIKNSKFVKRIQDFIDTFRLKIWEIEDKFKNNKFVKRAEDMLDTVRLMFWELQDKVKAAKEKVMPFVDTVKKFFTETLEVFAKPIREVIEKIKPAGGESIFKKIQNFITENPLVKLLDDFLEPIKKLTPIFTRIGAVAGKIFAPINLIMGVFETVSAFMKGYEETGTVAGGVREAAATFIAEMLGAPVDLLKDLVAWVAGKLGFTEFEKTLNELPSLTETIHNFVKQVWDWFGRLFEDPTAAISELWTGLVGEGGLLSSISGWLGKAWNWFKGFLPSDVANYLEETWNTLVGEGGFLGLLFAPFRALIKFVEDAIKWVLPEEYSDWSLLGIIDDALEKVSSWIESIFDFSTDLLSGNIPTIDDVLSGFKNMIRGAMEYVPDMLIPDSLNEWLNAPATTPTGAMVENGAAQVRTAGEANNRGGVGTSNNTVVTNAPTNNTIAVRNPSPYMPSKAGAEKSWLASFGY